MKDKLSSVLEFRHRSLFNWCPHRMNLQINYSIFSHTISQFLWYFISIGWIESCSFHQCFIHLTIITAQTRIYYFVSRYETYITQLHFKISNTYQVRYHETQKHQQVQQDLVVVEYIDQVNYMFLIDKFVRLWVVSTET